MFDQIDKKNYGNKMLKISISMKEVSLPNNLQKLSPYTLKRESCLLYIKLMCIR